MARIEPFDEHTAEYDEWFSDNHFAYLSEVEAIRRQLPARGETVEIGVGTGRFAARLAIDIGVDPSPAMRKIARQRGIRVLEGMAEALPFGDAEFDNALMVTTICFLDNITAALAETLRILNDGGCLVVGFIDKDSALGRFYQQHKEKNPFYRIATFYSAVEIEEMLAQAGFRDITFLQTIFQDLPNISAVEPIRPGHGTGSFVVARGFK